MIRPNMKDYHKNIFDPIFQRKASRKSFLNHNYFDEIWTKKKTQVNIVEQDELLKLELPLPGLKKSDIQVSVDGNILTIMASKHQKRVHPSKHILKEFNTDFMERTFKLKEKLGKEELRAEYKNDVLTLILKETPKTEKIAAELIEIK